MESTLQSSFRMAPEKSEIGIRKRVTHLSLTNSCCSGEAVLIPGKSEQSSGDYKFSESEIGADMFLQRALTYDCRADNN